MLLLAGLLDLPAAGRPPLILALYGVGAVTGLLVGGALRQRLDGPAGRSGAAISRQFQPVLAVAVLTAFVSALGWSLLWSLPLAGLALVADYAAVGLVIYQPKRWLLLDGIMAGLFCGFVMSLGEITVGLIDPGLI